jgi:peroxiredoxin
MKFGLLILIFLIFCNNISGQILIKGEFPGAEGREIRLVVIDDYLSFRPVEVASYRIDQDGYFFFSAGLTSPRNVQLLIDHNVSTFFAEPGIDYYVTFESFDFTVPQRRDVTWLQEEFDFTVSALKGEDLVNPNIDRLREVTNEFLETQNNLVRVNHRSALLAFEKKADSLFRDIDHEVFRGYYQYHFAYLHLSLLSMRPAQIIEKYLKDLPVDYENINYMYLLSRIFNSHIQGGSSKVTFFEIRDIINSGGSYSDLKTLFQKEQIFDTDQLRDLLILHELHRLYDNREINRNNIIGILTQMSMQSPFGDHRRMAINSIWSRTRLFTGHPAPELSLMHPSGAAYTLEDFQGKYLVLYFFTTWCQPCVADLGPLSSIAETMQQDVIFAGVIVDRDEQQAMAFIEKNDFPFQLYYFDHDYRLLERYRVNEVPVQMVIDPLGRLALNPLPLPAAGALDVLRGIVRSGRF